MYTQCYVCTYIIEAYNNTLYKCTLQAPAQNHKHTRQFYQHEASVTLKSSKKWSGTQPW